MDDQTAAFFMPAPDAEGAAPPLEDPPAVMMGMPPPPPQEEDGYEFAGGPTDHNNATTEDAFFGAPPAAAEPANEDNAFFGAPPAVSSESTDMFAAVDNNAVLVLEDPNQPTSYDYTDGGGGVLVEDGADDEPEPPAPPEISPMARWNQEWQVILKGRKDEENASKAKQVEDSRKEMDEFQAQREIKRETKMARNRAEEQSKLEAMEADLENDNSWQRVIKLVEFQQDSVEGGEDITRMRDVMIVLKNDTTRAVALS